MKGLLGNLIRRGAANDLDEEIVLRPGRQFSRQDIGGIAERGANEFRSIYMNLLSSFGPLEGEFGLYATLSNFIQTKNALTTEISEAIQDGDEVELTKAFMHSMEYSFITLFEKNALARLQLVENLPAESVAEYIRMKQSVGSSTTPSAIPAATPARVVPIVVETPAEVCAREFRELSSDRWKKKWLLDQRNRPVADLCVAEGRI